MQKAIAKEDLCEKIKKGEEVEIIPSYSYLFEQRVQDVFKLRYGEVVVRKVNRSTGTEALFDICKTERKKLIL